MGDTRDAGGRFAALPRPVRLDRTVSSRPAPPEPAGAEVAISEQEWVLRHVGG